MLDSVWGWVGKEEGDWIWREWEGMSSTSSINNKGGRRRGGSW
jgi:hypothetical protein